MPLRFLTNALEDIDAIHEYLAQFSPTAAQRFVNGVFYRAEQLENMPEMGRVVPELQRDTVRELLYQKYRIIYQLHEKGLIEIVSVQTGLRPLRLPLK